MPGSYQLSTKRGYPLSSVVSAMQKSIRRGDARLAGYMALEMWTSGYGAYCWRRLMIISAEDCWGMLTQEVMALHKAHELVRKQSSSHDPLHGSIFLAKAVILLCQAKKSRDADHLVCLVHGRMQVEAEELAQAFAQTLEDGEIEDLPDYVYDVHTSQGRRAGKTKDDFFQEEFEALSPREPGLFDETIQALRVTLKMF